MKGSDAIRGIPYSSLFRCPACGRSGLFTDEVKENVKKIVLWWNGRKDFTKEAWEKWDDPSWWQDFFRIVTCKCGQKWWTHDNWMSVEHHWEYDRNKSIYQFRLITQDLIDEYRAFQTKTDKWKKEKKTHRKGLLYIREETE